MLRGYLRTSSWVGIAVLFMAAVSFGAGQPLYVMVTVDVETTSKAGYEQSIWGRLPGRSDEHGIGRMMDVLDKHGVKGTFFANVYEAKGEANLFMRDVCREIHRRGHDVELHTHPSPVFGIWEMRQADLPTQTRIMEYGAGLIHEWIGETPVAHRAGAYGANKDTLLASSRAGIPLDFSFNMGWPGCELARSGITHNAPVVSGGVLVVPVTCYVQASAGQWRSLRFLDIEASSQAEFHKVIGELRDQGARVAVVMAHSFSLSRRGVVNTYAEENLERLVSGLVNDPGVKVVTARQLYTIWRADPKSLVGADRVPYTGWWMTYYRAWDQLGQGWVNTTVALGPPSVMGLLLVVGVWQRRRGKGADNRPAAV